MYTYVCIIHIHIYIYIYLCVFENFEASWDGENLLPVVRPSVVLVLVKHALEL